MSGVWYSAGLVTLRSPKPRISDIEVGLVMSTNTGAQEGTEDNAYRGECIPFKTEAHINPQVTWLATVGVDIYLRCHTYPPFYVET